MQKTTLLFVIGFLFLAGACQPAPTSSGAPGIKVLAVETFLGDIAQNIAGNRLKIETLIPIGLDPHAFEPTPRDVARIADSQVLIINGAGFEHWIEKILATAGGKRVVIEAAAGLKSRAPQAGSGDSQAPGESDPHFWLDPILVIQYSENIRAGLTQADPSGAEQYQKNAAQYAARLQELDRWIQEQVRTIPPERRLLVTNHESLGYFADRYGFKITGALVPSVSSGSAPSAQQLAALTDQMRKSKAPAIFLETSDNPQLAQQIARETGVKVISDLLTHSVTEAGGAAPGYIEMMRYNVQKIVEALK